MFYLLNFENHQFISCDNASVVEGQIRNLLANGCSEDSIEIINGFGDEARMQVREFRSLCEEQGLVENSIADSLVEKEERLRHSDAAQNGAPDISLWARLGISLNVTPEELAVLKSDDVMKAEALFIALVRSERCSMSGDTYFPEECNEEFIGDMEEVLSFDLDCALHNDVQAKVPDDRVAILDNAENEIAIRLPRRDWENVVDAMEYAIDDRRYEAEQTRDPADRAEINAAADSWEKSREVIGAAVNRWHALKEERSVENIPALDDAISAAEKLSGSRSLGKDDSTRER